MQRGSDKPQAFTWKENEKLPLFLPSLSVNHLYGQFRAEQEHFAQKDI